mgnify:CR=1 FL=1
MSVVEAKPKLKRSDLIWTLIGLVAVVASCFLLYRELRTISLDEIADSLRAISHLNWLLAACALLVVAYLYPGVQVQNFGSALIAAAVVGVFYTLLRPLMIVLTLPVTVVTLGLFLFVINALLFWAAAGLLDGFHVNGFLAALLGSLIYSALMLVVDAALKG